MYHSVAWSNFFRSEDFLQLYSSDTRIHLLPRFFTLLAPNGSCRFTRTKPRTNICIHVNIKICQILFPKLKNWLRYYLKKCSYQLWAKLLILFHRVFYLSFCIYVVCRFYFGKLAILSIKIFSCYWIVDMKISEFMSFVL